MCLTKFKDQATNVKNIRPTENDGGLTKPKEKILAKVHRQKSLKNVGKPQAKKNKNKKYKAYQCIVEATQMPNSNIK